MRKINFLFLVLFLFVQCLTFGQVERREKGNLVIEGIPEFPESLVERINQYQNTRMAEFQDWDADGNGIFIGTRFAETKQIHYVSMPGGSRKQLTFFPEPISGVAVRPDKVQKGFLFSKDIGGNEQWQIYYYDLEKGSSEMVTDGKSRSETFFWANDGKEFYYMCNKRNGKDFDIYKVNTNNMKNSEMIFEGKGYWIPLDISPDKTKLLLLNYISINQSSINIYDLKSKSLNPIQTSDEALAMGSAKWNKEGNGIYFTSDYKSEFKRLQYYDTKSEKVELITKDINWDVDGFSITKDCKEITFLVNENGMSRLYRLDTEKKTYQPVPNIPVGIISAAGYSPDGQKYAFTLNSSKTAGDVYVISRTNPEPVRWTFSETGGLNADNFITPELIHYPTFDSVDGKQRMIPAFYYRPKGDGPFPVVINFHGGPEGQYQPSFAATIQYYLNELGIAVIAPNVRGSSGYGKTYLQLDNGLLRENSVKDGGALLDWIGTRSELDSKKICVSGGSYGGYMSLAMMTHYNDRLAAGIDVVGISNFITFLNNTGEYRRDLRRAEYGDERNPEMKSFLEKISPMNNSKKITKPMFIIQGLNDPRVPVTEAEQMVKEIRNNGGMVWYLMAKDEGHGFSKKTNRDFYQTSVALFLKEFLSK